MKSGAAPTTTMSSTTIPTRSWPIVSCLPSACAIAIFVPTPSVDVARTGFLKRVSADASQSPAKPPTPPRTCGPWVAATERFISSTAVSPAAVSTPEAAYRSTGPAAFRPAVAGWEDGGCTTRA